jgi:hypothetical protein
MEDWELDRAQNEIDKMVKGLQWYRVDSFVSKMSLEDKSIVLAPYLCLSMFRELVPQILISEFRPGPRERAVRSFVKHGLAPELLRGPAGAGFVTAYEWSERYIFAILEHITDEFEFCKVARELLRRKTCSRLELLRLVVRLQFYSALQLFSTGEIESLRKPQLRHFVYGRQRAARWRLLVWHHIQDVGSGC